MKKERITPQRAGGEKRVAELKSDNFETEESWIVVQNGTVTIGNQKTGEGPTGIIVLSISEFDRMFDWYTTEQVSPHKQNETLRAWYNTFNRRTA